MKTLKPVRSSIGIEVAYRRRLLRLVSAMTREVERRIAASYRRNEPTIMAADALPFRELRKTVREMAAKWLKRFDEAAPRLAEYFATSVENRSRKTLMRILKDGGWTVKFTMTAGQRDVIGATIQENVALIRSIPSQYFTQIEGMVMRSVTTGRDLSQLSKDLQKQFGVSKRRAQLIARDQNNKATASLTAARNRELGLYRAVWQHTGAGKEPRPAHVAMNGKVFDIRKGMWDPHERKWIQPGELINCRCTSRAIVPGFS